MELPSVLALFLSTLPARGATAHTFNHLFRRDISIHAPREGSDTCRSMRPSRHPHFYPRSPRGERPDGISALLAVQDFYPRSPRGERRARFRRCRLFRLISIHAPREGSDKLSIDEASSKKYFYPRSPRGERPLKLDAWAVVSISIHAPREGSDHGNIGCVQIAAISIHAPREGSDKEAPRCGAKTKNFYPRSPRGERP